MRNVKVAAIQPELIQIPECYRPLSVNYKNDPKSILDNYIRKQLEVTIRLLEIAGSQGCDIVCSCEDVTMSSEFALDISENSIFPVLVDMSKPLVETFFSEIAKKYSMYVIGCYLSKQNGKIYNIASIFNRKGSIVGEYKKTHLPANEIWICTPGDSLDVFNLDFGKIGISICYDMMFPETVRVLALKGAEIIFHPTFGYGWYDSIGEATLRTRANDSGVYIITSKNYNRHNTAGKSSIIDYWGQILCDAGFNANTIVTKKIDLDEKKKQPDWYYNAYMTGSTEVSNYMSKERRPEIYSAICSPNEKLRIPDQEEKLKILEAIKNGECHW